MNRRELDVLRQRADSLITARLSSHGLSCLGKNAWGRAAGEIEHRVNGGLLGGPNGQAEFTMGSVGLRLRQVEGYLRPRAQAAPEAATVGVSLLLLGAPQSLESRFVATTAQLDECTTEYIHVLAELGLPWLDRFASLGDVLSALEAPEWTRSFGCSIDRRDAIRTAIVGHLRGAQAGMAYGETARRGYKSRLDAAQLDHVLQSMARET